MIAKTWTWRLMLAMSLLSAPSIAGAQDTEPTADGEPDDDRTDLPLPPELVDETREPISDDLVLEIERLQDEVKRLRERLDAGEAAAGGHLGTRTTDLEQRAAGAVRWGGVATVATAISEQFPGQFVLPRVGLFAFAPLAPRVRFSGEATFLGGGAEYVDGSWGLPGRGDPFLQYAAADVDVIPERLSLRAGLIAIPIGRSNRAADEGARDLLIRSAPELVVAPAPWVDVGGGIVGAARLGAVELAAQVYVVSGPSDGVDARTGLAGARQPPGADENNDKAIAARIAVRPAGSVEVGAGAYSGSYSPGGGRRLSVGALDGTLDVGPMRFEGEGIVAVTDGGVGPEGDEIPRQLFGGSGQLTWRLLAVPLARWFPEPFGSATLGLTARYAFVDTDKANDDETVTDDPDELSRRERLGLGLALRPHEGFVVRAEYEFRTEGGANPIDDDRAVLSATVSF